MTQKELAIKTGIRPNTINEWYHEFVERINIDHLNRICEVLDCTIPDLLEYIPDDKPSPGTALVLEEHGNRKRKLG